MAAHARDSPSTTRRHEVDTLLLYLLFWRAIVVSDLILFFFFSRDAKVRRRRTASALKCYYVIYDYAQIAACTQRTGEIRGGRFSRGLRAGTFSICPVRTRTDNTVSFETPRLPKIIIIPRELTRRNRFGISALNAISAALCAVYTYIDLL